MLARYNNFPKNVHETEHFAASLSTGKLQQTFTEAFYKLNNETLNTEKASIPSVSNYIVTLEFGVADGNDFNYIDREEKTKIIKAVKTKPLQAMDFLCAIRYYKIEGDKKTPLKFDYLMLRLVFDKNLVEVRVFHERGPRRITPEEIISLIVDKINADTAKRILKPFKPAF
jgi:hypothetical protein